MERKGFRLLLFAGVGVLEWHLVSAAAFFMLWRFWGYGLVFAVLAVCSLALAIAFKGRTDKIRYRSQWLSPTQRIRLCLAMPLVVDVPLFVLLVQSAVHLYGAGKHPLWVPSAVATAIPLGGILIALGGLAASLRVTTSDVSEVN